LVALRVQQTQELPWADLIHQRGMRGYDAAIEPQLIAKRVAHFFESERASS
jgi:hypothetical protein